MRHILLVDDEDDLLWLVGRALYDEGYTVRMAHNGVEALNLAQLQRPDLMVLDVSMPQMNGFELCAALHTHADLADIPVLFLTGRNTVDDRIRGFDEGADDYMSKPFDLRELKARVRALIRRSRGAAASAERRNILRVGSLSLDLHTYQAEVSGTPVQLTPAEFDLLGYLMRHPNEVCSSDRLLREVWNYAPDTAEPGLVRWHVMNLRSKIEPDPHRPVRLCTVARHGYILRGDQAG
ncbi:response regulator transcription factor [Oscillochloris sp. ZM17-4]|uniref:response regulator transcription factor n=1 Tax=Oscillochloris sp. ZM17-4 TaxID=2866714 RepID=UPI001C730F91|nr:response regulator transcription factor [Oscillochloris sp. ZM17-4]MBX0331510.1 response regulator transcription factor [Oscillochloris sp. ZM17-4]